MTPAEIAAYIGAAAWLPQIATWAYRKFVQPAVTIVPDKYAEVGFTPFGPIFNVRMAFSTENKDLIVDGFELLLRHSDGDTRTLRWSGLSETFSEITDAAGNRQVVSRDQTPIALKIGTESLIEKFVRFQEPRYHEIDRPAGMQEWGQVFTLTSKGCRVACHGEALANPFSTCGLSCHRAGKRTETDCP